MDHFYVFTTRKGWKYPAYERTFPTAEYAYMWLLTSRTGKRHEGFVLKNCLPKKYYY